MLSSIRFPTLAAEARCIAPSLHEKAIRNPCQLCSDPFTGTSQRRTQKMSIFIPIILDTEKYYEHSFASSRALVGSPVLVCHLIEPPLSTSFVFEIATTQDGPAKYAQRSNHNWNLIMRCCKMEQITCIPCQVLILRTIWRQPNIRTIYYMLNISSLSSSVLCP